MSADIAPSLRANAGDHAASSLQALTSAVDLLQPGAGSFFGALIGQVIPNQRVERLAEFATRLGRRLVVAEGAVENLHETYKKLAESLGVQQRALFEDGAYAASRATSNERLEAIANVVSEGLSADEVRASEQRRLLHLLSELTDEDVVALCQYTMKYRNNTEWRDRNAAALAPRFAALGGSQEQFDQKTLREIRNRHLLMLGVLVEKPSGSSGSMRTELSPIGRFVLRQLGLLDEREI